MCNLVYGDVSESSMFGECTNSGCQADTTKAFRDAGFLLSSSLKSHFLFAQAGNTDPRISEHNMIVAKK